MKTTGIAGAGDLAAIRSARDQGFVDSNVEHFARTMSELGSTSGFRVKAEVQLGQKPFVRFTVESEADATALRELFADKDLMSLQGLSGAADFSTAQPAYSDQGWLRDGVAFTVEVGKLQAPAPAAPVEAPHRADGWQNNVGTDGLPRLSTNQEMVQTNIRGLGQTLKGLANTNGISARVEVDGAVGLRITVADQQTADTLTKMLLDPKERELSSYTGKLEAAGPGAFSYADAKGGWLEHSVPIELKVGSLQPRQVEY